MVNQFQNNTTPPISAEPGVAFKTSWWTIKRKIGFSLALIAILSIITAVIGFYAARMSSWLTDQSIVSIQTTLLVLTGFVLIVGVVAFISITRAISTPIDELRSSAEHLASGRFNLTTKLFNNDEIGALAYIFNQMRIHLHQLVLKQEQRIDDLKSHNAKFNTSIKIGQALVENHDLSLLYKQAVNIIAEHFGFEHVGLFLLNDSGETASLISASSDVGSRLVDEKLSFSIYEDHILCQSINSREPCNSTSQENESIQYTPFELPYPCSQHAFPVRLGDQVLGVLDIHTFSKDQLTDENTEMLQWIANQLAIAINNAQMISEAQSALETYGRSYQQTSQESWAAFLQERPDWGYVYQSKDTTQLREKRDSEWSPNMRKAARTGQIVQDIEEQGITIAIPIKVRNRVVGVLDFKKGDPEASWTPEEVTILETLTEELGQALESAQLFEDTQRRAAREQLARQITDRIRRASTVESVVQTAVDELFQATGSSRHVFVRLEIPSSPQEE
jgi:GAF domain-containing protein/HAMP domain-containing protein